MGQNDLNSSPNIVEAGRSLAQKNIVIEKGMCQSRKNFSRCQNGKKQFGESKCCMDFKNPRKRIKMSKDLEKAEEKVFTNVTMSKECTQKIGEITSIADSSMTSEKLKCNGATLSSLDTSGFLLEQHTQKPPDQMVGLFDSKKVDKAHFVPYNSSEFEKSEVVESKSMEPQIDLTSQKEDEDPTVVKMLASEKITSYSSNTADHLKREKRTPKVKTISKAGRKLQLFSCQRVVPISGKNEWPRESCARTSIWVHKNHAWDSERRFLRGTDSVANSGQVELHKPLTDISEGSVNKIVECTTELPDKSSASECLPGTCNAVTAVCNENRLFSTDTEGPKQYLSTKKVKKSKETLILPGKNKGSIVKRNISIDTQNGVFADRSKREMCQKFSLAKEEQLLRTLNTRNLTNFKIPLLKNKGIVSQKIEHTRSPVKETCNPLDILENAAAVQEARATEMPSDANFGHFSKQSNITTLDTPLDKLHNGFPESRSKETCTGICNEGVAVSYENVIEPSTWQENSSSLSSGYIEKQMLDSTVASEIKGKDDSNFAQHKDNLYADILKAYEDDVLVLDVIQDDPDLFGDTNEQEATSTKEYSRNYFDASTFSKEKLELKESESSLLPRSRHLKCCPRESPIQDYGTLKSVADGYVSVIEADKVKSDSLNGTGSTGGVKESCFEDGQLTELDNLIKISDSNEKYNSLDKRGAVKEEKANFQEFAKIENAEYVEPASHDHKPELPLSAGKAVALQWQGAALKPWMNDFRFPRNVPPLPSAYPNSYDAWKVNTNDVTNLGLNGLPNRYCRLYFNTLNGCLRKTCWYLHVPESGNEKICNEILKKYISIGEVALLQRAVQIFTDYYKEVTAVVHLNSHILNELLTSLLQFCLMKELFSVFHTCITIKILPSVDLLLKVFEHVTMMKIREAVPELIDISCKLVDVGMVLEYEHFSHISKFLNQLQVSSQEITVFASRFQAGHFHKASLGDFDSAIVEFQHCKEKGDWAKLGTLYINVRRVCENFSDLEKYSLCIANTLTNSVTEDTPGVPFCVFATAVYTDSRHNEADTTLLGRIGISVLFSYYRTQQWSKAKKVLDALFALRISFTFLKGLIGQERSAPRCQIVNIAVEIFLKSGNLDGALWILRESEWVINTHSWPCDRMDVLNRHNLLCKMASEYITKSCYKEAFEVLQNLPGFQNSCDTLDVSQYSLLFNKLLADCSEGKNISISSAVTEFMLAKNIPIEFHLLRALITALGRSHLWIKARTYYKNALALGCYPPLEGNLYRKLLLIPSHMTEIEMLLAIEIFLVSNASSIQSPGASSHILQIVLKRCEGDNVRNKDDYHSAADRLIQAARISTPKLFIKHLTVNVNKEQVYSLEYAAALRWLKENMKWAGKAWLFQ